MRVTAAQTAQGLFGSPMLVLVTCAQGTCHVSVVGCTIAALAHMVGTSSGGGSSNKLVPGGGGGWVCVVVVVVHVLVLVV